MNTGSHAIMASGVARLLGATVLTGILWAIPAGGAHAADTNLLEQRFQVAIGTFTNATRIEIRVDGEAGETGTKVDWKDTFGDQDQTRFRLDGLWRISDRHFMRLMYTDYSQSSIRTIEDEITWRGEVIPVNATATGRSSFDIIELAYEYAFVRSADLEVTGSFGLHYAKFAASLRAEADVEGEQVTEERGGRASTGAPLPVVGARALRRVHGNFYLDVLGQAFYLSLDEYRGRILNARGVLTWQPKSQLGLGLGYDWFRVDLDVDRSKFNGRLDWTYRGPQVFLSMSF